MSSRVAVKATKQDYLVGKEFFCQENLGNELFRALINLHFHKYQQAGRHSSVRKKIKEHIVDQIRDNGGRFLKRVDLGSPTLVWVELSRHDALLIVVNGFRNKRRETTHSTTSSSTISDGPPMPQIAEDEQPLGGNSLNNLTLTLVFDTLTMSLQDCGFATTILADFDDDHSGVAELFTLINENPDEVFKEYGFIKPLHQKRLRGFGVWYATYCTHQRAFLDKGVWVDFFRKWVGDGCPSLAQWQSIENASLTDQSCFSSLKSDDGSLDYMVGLLPGRQVPSDTPVSSLF